MWTITISLFAGILIGIFFKISDKRMKFNAIFQKAGLILLIFSMGAVIGSDKKVIMNIKLIGLKSVTFAVLTSLFSIIIVYFATKHLSKGAGI